MKLTVEEINYIAKLAKLKFSEEEAKEFAKDFEEILVHFKNISQDNFEDSSDGSQSGKNAPLREDKIEVFKDKEKLFHNVKKMRESYIEIPKVIE